MQQASQAVQEISKSAQLVAQRSQELDAILKDISMKLDCTANEGRKLVNEASNSIELADKTLSEGRDAKEALSKINTSLSNLLNEIQN